MKNTLILLYLGFIYITNPIIGQEEIKATGKNYFFSVEANLSMGTLDNQHSEFIFGVAESFGITGF